MKTLRFLIVALALMFTVGIAQAQAQGLRGLIGKALGNQSEQPSQQQPAAAPKVEGRTPSQIIAACPAFPSLNDLVITNVGYDMELRRGGPFEEELERAHNRIQAFYDAFHPLDRELDSISEQITEAMRAKTAATVQREGEAFARQTTGRSMAEIQNMSEAELEAMGAAIANQRAGAAGLGSMADIQALEGKSQEEILAATAGTGPVQGGTPAALKMAAPDPAVERAQAEKAKRDADIQTARVEIEEELERIYQRHRPALISRLRILEPLIEMTVDGLDADDRPKFEAAYPAAQHSLETATEAYLTDYYSYLLGALKGMKDRLAALEATVPEMKAPRADPAGINAYDIAQRYLEIAGSIVSYSDRFPTDADL